MNEPQQANFEGWAIVELMGHQREIGFVTTQAFGQAVLFRIDTPELPEREFVLTTPEYAEGDGVDHRADRWYPAGSKVTRVASPARSRLVAPGSLYAINPCTEAAARTALEKTAHRPLILIEAPEGKALPPAVDADIIDDHEDDEDDWR